jgi:hypothetical protein
MGGMGARVATRPGDLFAHELEAMRAVVALTPSLGACAQGKRAPGLRRSTAAPDEISRLLSVGRQTALWHQLFDKRVKKSFTTASESL